MRHADRAVHREQRVLGPQHRLVLVDVHRGHAGPTLGQRGLERARNDEPGAARVDEDGGGLHPREILRGHHAAGRVDQPHVNRDHVRLGEEGLAARGGGVAVGLGLLERALAAPREHVHAERAPVARHHRADLAVAQDAQGLAAQPGADRIGLPLARAHRDHLLGDAPHRRDHQAPGQLRGRVGRPARHLARRDDHTPVRARGDVDVGNYADLGDHLQPIEAVEQRRADRGALADAHEHLGILEPAREGVDVLGVVLPDRDVLAGHLLEGVQRADRVLVVVEDRNLHEGLPPSGAT